MRPGSVFKPRPGNDEKINACIGRKIKLMRVEKGLSQSELADKVGLSQVTISRLEKGYDNVSLTKLDSIVRALKTKFPLEFPLLDRCKCL